MFTIKRIFSVLMIVAMLAVSGIVVGCNDDEVKVHKSSNVTTTETSEVVVP